MSSFASADTIDLTRPSTELTRMLCDIPSVSGDEARIADAIEAALAPFAHLQVLRLGNTIVARVEAGEQL